MNGAESRTLKIRRSPRCSGFPSDTVTGALSGKGGKADSLKYIDVLNYGLKVMDSTAISLCMDNDIPLIVFDMMTDGNMKRAVMGEVIGTYVGGKDND